jgi:hypothetical protein
MEDTKSNMKKESGSQTKRLFKHTIFCERSTQSDDWSTLSTTKSDKVKSR